MDDIFNNEEAAEQKHSEECFCQLCRPVLSTEDEDRETVVALYEPVAA